MLIVRRIALPVLLVLAVTMIGAAGCASQKAVKAIPDLAWPSPPEQPKIKLINYYTGKEDVSPDSTLLKLIGEEENVRLVRPHGVVADREGNVYVSDIGYGVWRVYGFDFARKDFMVIGASGSVRLKVPLGLAIDNERRLLFVADGGNNAVYAFDKDSGNVKFVIGQQPGTLMRAASVAVDPARERVYVADTKLQMIKVFTYQDQFLFSIGKGERSDADDGFNVPSQIALDRDGNLYVADMFNRYIKVFNPEGKFVKKIGHGLGASYGYFSKLVGVAVDSEGHVYGLDTDFCNFQVFDQDNNLLIFVGEPGGQLGRFLNPSNIYVDEFDRIYVTDTMNSRIQVFQYLGKQPGK